ncbi:MAG: SCO family protein [Gammaproteobacteria bacterium]
MKIRYLIICTLLLTACERAVKDDAPVPGSHAAVAEAEVRVIADGWVAELPYDVPKPGSYTLSKINNAAGGAVLGVDGKELELDSLLGDKIVLLTFIYSSCTDLNGCPLATAVFYKIKERFKDNPKLADKIRLISISFDPEHDTPEVMRLYGAGFDGGEPEWLFLTTASEEVLLPITNSYGQMMIKQYDSEGNYTGAMAHVLRAFLIDRSKNIRQEYSVSFLHDELVNTDIMTLLIEDGIIEMDDVEQ